MLPMAIELGTTVAGRRGGDRVLLRSAEVDGACDLPLDIDDPAAVEPSWARYVAGVVAELRPSAGFEGRVSTTVPIGSGLSSSAALEVSVALALGASSEDPVDLAQLCQRAEQRASGVPCGIMDQLASTAGVPGQALRVDCTTLEVRPVPVPAGLDVLVVDSQQPRELAGSAYAERAAACTAAARIVGPLPQATLADLGQIQDPVVRRRARHVVTECQRVDATCAALASSDREGLKTLMAASHASLRDDFEVSTDLLDLLVARLVEVPGVIGARLTGAGFGGCVVALASAGTELPDDMRSWRVHPSAGARQLAD